MRVLFGIFDWGLGHATRDIPLITELLRENEVHVLSTGRALHLLRGHFGRACAYYDVPSIYPPYTRTRLFQLKFGVSVPRMIRTLRRARRRSKRIIRNGFDIVISDCRYDVFDRPENSFLINHQLRFKTPRGAERFVEKWLALRMRKYRYVFVPDYEDVGLSGMLSHGLRYIPRQKVKYIGLLSHLRRRDMPEDIDYFISLSGPEPQRRILEKRIKKQLNQLEGKVVMAGGTPEINTSDLRGNVEYFSFLDNGQQEEMMNRARFIITRAGYTTIMELAELDKRKALLLPTPGQTEQEYLADHFEAQGYFHHVSQYKLRLTRDTEAARRFNGFDPPWRTEVSTQKFVNLLYDAVRSRSGRCALR
jgi:UDP:flavonoid glycosyltransferase YjiC (YdhE family)